jgi:hypothetical protein
MHRTRARWAEGRTARRTPALPPLPEPYNYAPILVGIWMVIGVVLYVVLRGRSPEAIAQLGAAVSEG